MLGVKVRITDNVVGTNGVEPLRRARRAAELAGKGFRVMCHIGAAPGNLADVLDLLRPGDILTHSYSGAGNNIVQNGQLIPAAKAAKQRGVIFDVGHGAGSFNWEIAERALQQGAPPQTISSDLHVYNVNGPVYDLATTVTKFLHLGLSLDASLEKVTAVPAQVVGMARDFAGDDQLVVCLGDNIFEHAHADAIKAWTKGALVFVKDVPDPENFGVVAYGDGGYGKADLTSNFNIGRNQVTKINTPDHKMDVYHDGTLAVSYPTSNGLDTAYSANTTARTFR